ncbi:NADPH-dependent FMN reductase [Yinghuangia seranimata]|uniref:NADPH-dependent FMN reductase n=1 Tax=Yinghuangia seranimata TaxID=408067 RepID=UPI00248AA457|nr:NAD(P)H-dependent oxidoreductase [Yinghuangia seranimata]MDI2126606.1 NAD(P)H-dependent oxidoreductase [Yinghuangia seranimata]
MTESTTQEQPRRPDFGVETFRLAVIIGSVRDNRVGTVVADWFIRQVERRAELDIDVIDLAEVDLPVAVGRKPAPPESPTAYTVRRRLDAADAYVVVTPEYQHACHNSLKRLVDWHSSPWQAKPVGFVSYGSAVGGNRAIELLRPVFADCHAMPVPDKVVLPTMWNLLGTDTLTHRPAPFDAAAETMLDRVAWWAVTLRRGRELRPYAA